MFTRPIIQEEALKAAVHEWHNHPDARTREELHTWSWPTTAQVVELSNRLKRAARMDERKAFGELIAEHLERGLSPHPTPILRLEDV